jgi:hypothetical protein
MSGFPRFGTVRSDNLYEFARRLIDGENGKLLIGEYKAFVETVTAAETMQILDRLLLEGYSVEQVKRNVGKIINVFYISLNENRWNKPGEGHFLYYLMLENREVEKIIAEARPAIKSILQGAGAGQEIARNILRNFITRLKDYELHYIKKENILFPYLEKAFPEYRCLKLMWSFHDDFRESLKILESELKSDKPGKELLNRELGRLFFVIFPIIFREEQIVYPVSLQVIRETDWEEMLKQSFETGWCYNIMPLKKENTGYSIKDKSGMINLDTGFLSPEQLVLLLNNLPVDITFVDQNDEVRYFSGAKHRIFPRLKAIIGRKVQDCHPPESVHVVNEIIDAFRKGIKDHADFWIQAKGRFIHIRYFALRNQPGEYMGTIEVSQDVTEIRELKGERRLLNWKK